MPQQPDPAEARIAARLLAAGRSPREAADVLRVSAKHVKRTVDRGLNASEREAQAVLAEVAELRAALRTGVAK